MIIFNSDSLISCSLGVKNYFRNVNYYLQLKGSESTAYNYKGLLTRTNQDEVLWTPGQGGSVVHPLQVITCHDVIDFSHYKLSPIKRIKKYIHGRLYKKAKHIVFISDSSLEDFTNTFPSISTERSVIKSPNFINGDLSKCIYPSELQNYILVISNNLKHKNNEDIFSLAEMFFYKQLGCQVVIVGDIVLPKKYEHLLGSSLIILNNLTAQEMLGLQAKASLYISSSLIEGHNLPIAEALGVNTPVIASSISAHREFYEGLIEFYEAGNVDELFEKSVIKLNKKTSTNISKSPARTWENVADEYLNIFRKVAES